MTDRPPKPIEDVVRDALTSSLDHITWEMLQVATSGVVDAVARSLGEGTLRSEVQVRHIHHKPEMRRTYYTEPIEVDRPRTVWTSKEREFKLAMRRIDARGEIPHKSRIYKELGLKRTIPYYVRHPPYSPAPFTFADQRGYIQLSGRQSRWQQEEYRAMGYARGANSRWFKPGRDPEPDPNFRSRAY